MTREEYEKELKYVVNGDQDPCEDAISRQAVIDILRYECSDKVERYLRDKVETLPSVAPKQKMDFDGMTNGEVIDLLFPGTDIYHNRDFTLREMIFPDEWWDAPYKAESEETE